MYLLLTVIAAVATLWGVRAFGPYYEPYCGLRPMSPGDVCVSWSGGGGSYERKLVEREWNDRILFASALPVLVLFGVLTGRDVSGRRRRAKALARLAANRQWSVDPPDARMPRHGDAAGAPLGPVVGRLDGRTIVVQRYATWTHVAVNLPVTALPEVTVTFDPASGQARYVGAIAFGQQLLTPQVHDVARRSGVTEFTVHRGALSHGRPGMLPAADIDAARPRGRGPHAPGIRAQPPRPAHRQFQQAARHHRLLRWTST